MAVTNVGLSWNDCSKDDSGNIRITSGTTAGNMHVKFRTGVFRSSYRDSSNTEHVTCEQKYVDVAVAVRTVPRGNGAVNGYGDWRKNADGSTRWWYRRFTATESGISHQDMDGFFQWSVPLSALLPGDPILEELVTGGDEANWAFAKRRYDEIQLRVKVKTLYAVEGWSQDQSDPTAGLVVSPLAVQDCWVGFRPSYACTGVRLTSKGLEISYSSPDWSRATDRFSVESLTQGGSTLIDGKPWGTVSRNGLLVVPMDSLRRIPDVTALTGRVRFNAVWRPPDADFATMAVSVTPTSNQGVRTPVLALTVDGGDITAVATDPGGSGLALATVTIKLRGSSLSCDQATVAPGEPVVFRCLPSGPVTVDAVGAASNGQPSNRASATATVAHVTTGGDAIVPLDGSAPVRLLYNVKAQWTGKPESVTEKLAGRTRQSAWFGEGGEATLSVSFDFSVAPWPGVTAQPEEDVMALAYCGPCILLLHGRERVLVEVESVSLSDPTAGFDRIRNATLSLREVA